MPANREARIVKELRINHGGEVNVGAGVIAVIVLLIQKLHLDGAVSFAPVIVRFKIPISLPAGCTMI